MWPSLEPPPTMTLCTSGFADDATGQNQARRYVSLTSPDGGTGGEVAVHDCRLVDSMTSPTEI